MKILRKVRVLVALVIVLTLVTRLEAKASDITEFGTTDGDTLGTYITATYTLTVPLTIALSNVTQVIPITSSEIDIADGRSVNVYIADSDGYDASTGIATLNRVAGRASTATVQFKVDGNNITSDHTPVATFVKDTTTTNVLDGKFTVSAVDKTNSLAGAYTGAVTFNVVYD